MLLIDYSGILIPNIVVLNGNLGDALTGREIRGALVESILSLSRALSTTYGTPVLCCDQHSWRRDVFPQYKARRRAANDPQDIHAVIERLNVYGIEEEIGSAFGWPVVKAQGAEGDDVIATLTMAMVDSQGDGSFFAKLNSDSMLCQRSVIVSQDKDFDQLGNMIEIFNPKKHEFKKPDAALSLKELILRGDASDGVPSINNPDDYFTADPPPKRTAVNKKFFDSLPAVLTEEAILSVCPEKIDNYRRNDRLVNLKKIPMKVRQDVLLAFQAQEDRLKTHKPDPMSFYVKWGLLDLIS